MTRPIFFLLGASLVVLASCGSSHEDIQGDLGALAFMTDSQLEDVEEVQSVVMFQPTHDLMKQWQFNGCDPSFEDHAKRGGSVSLKPETRTYTVKIPCEISPGTVNQVVLNITLGDVTNIRARFKAKGKVLCSSEALQQPVTREPEAVFLGMSNALSLDSTCDSVELVFTGSIRKKATRIYGVDLMWIPPASMLPMVSASPSTGEPIELAGECRMGICLGSGWSAKSQAQMPSGAELRFSFGIPQQALFANVGGGLELTISAEGAESVKKTIPLKSISSWNDASVDLDGFEGKLTSLEFFFRSEGSSNALLALSTPRIVKPKSGAKHVVLITSDTHRGDHLGVADSGVEIRTPFLDELAEEGVFFEDCMSTTNITVPSHMAMMTGNSPKAMGLIDNMTALSPSSVTLAEHFRDAGYYTVSVLSTKHLRHDNSGLGQGFDRSISTEQEKQLGHVSTEIIQKVIEEEGDQPCFIWLHVFDAHAPYSPPDEYRYEYYPEDRNPYTQGTGIVDGGRASWDPRIRDLEFILAQYRSEITYLDETLEAVFDEPAFDDAIIAFTADHGECLGTHGIFFKHTGLYSDTVDVPLILRWPNCPAGARVKTPVQNVNLGRTLLDLAGLGTREFPGVSLLEALAEDAPSRPRFAIGAHGHCAVVEKDGWLCVLTLQSKGVPNAKKHQVELFDLRSDPGCLVDLVDEEFERAKRLRGGLIEWLSADRIEGMTVTRAQQSVELLEAIAALGYATESGGGEGPYYKEDPDDEWCKRFK